VNADITVVKASHLQPFIEFLDAAGAPVDDLLRQVDMERSQFSAADNLIPEAPFWALLDLVAHSENIPDIGFKVTEQLSLDRFGSFGRKVMQAETLQHALQLFIDDMGEQSNCPPFWLTQAQDSVWFCRLGTQGIKMGQWPVEQHVVSMMVQLVRAFTGQDWHPAQVYLQTNSIVGCEKVSLLADGDIALNKAITAICIPQELLKNPPMKSGETVKSAPLLSTKPIPLACSELVVDVIKQRANLLPLKAEIMAKSLGVSVRQLQRLLKKDNTSFRELSEHELFDRAKNMLIQGELSILDIALELGYVESANFTRAFKRMSGVSPSHYKSLSQAS